MSKLVALQKPLLIETNAVQKAAFVLNVLYHPLRVRIIHTINNSGKTNAQQLAKELKLPQSEILQHLKLLTEARLLNTAKKGHADLYSVDSAILKKALKLADRLAPSKTDIAHTTELRPVHEPKDSESVKFTATELAIIHMVCEQKKSSEIAQKLKLNKHTIENYRSGIKKKMKVKNSVGILIYAVKKGIFKI
jgi:DNA-binding CsgD family transcriptional regulator